MNKEFQVRIKHKKCSKRWEKGQVSQEECRDTVRICRYVVRKGKAHLKLNLQRDMRVQQERFLR